MEGNNTKYSKKIFDLLFLFYNQPRTISSLDTKVEKTLEDGLNSVQNNTILLLLSIFRLITFLKYL